jgi:hypothetical protein
MSVIIPLALKSISTVVPPINIDGSIYGLFVKDETTYFYGNFNTITGIDRNKLASFDNNTKTITTFYQNGSAFGFHYGAAPMKTPDNTDAVIIRGGSRIFQLDATTGEILSSSPVYVGVSNILDFYTDPYVTNSEIFTTGTYSKIGGVTKNGFAKFNNNLSFNSVWRCAPNPASTVYCMCSSDLPTHIYAGGQFTSIRGVTRRCIARVRKTDGAVDTSFTYTPIPGIPGSRNSISSMDLAPNGTLWIAGTIVSENRPILRGLNSNGTFLAELTGILPSTPLGLNSARQIKIHPNELKIYATLRSFNTSSGKYMSILARFHPLGDGSIILDTTFNSPSGYVLFVDNSFPPDINFDFDLTNDLIVAGGKFNWVGDWDLVNGNSVSNFAYLSSDGSFISI